MVIMVNGQWSMVIMVKGHNGHNGHNKGHLEKGFGNDWMRLLYLLLTENVKNVFGSHAYKLAHENSCNK